MTAVRRTAGLVALLALAARLPFVARRMWDHDSIQFALAVRDFDLAAHHPHPPGYPLYVGLLKVLAVLGVDPLHGMVALSLAASTVGAACFALVVARLSSPPARPAPPGAGAPPPSALTAAEADRAAAQVALLAGVLYATNPLLWFYGELPLVYAVEGGLTAVLAWAAVRLADGPRAFYVACVLFGFSGGLRPSTQMLLFPLFVYGVVCAARRRDFVTWRRLATGAAVAGACTLAWVVPLLVASGGLPAYRRIAGAHFTQLLPVTSVLYGAGLPALTHNLTVLVKWASQGVLPGLAAVAVAWALVPRRAGEGLRLLVSRLGWIVAWGLPPVVFFACFHVTKAGYTLIHLPALLAAVVLLAAPVLRHGEPATVGGRECSAAGRRVRRNVIRAAAVSVGAGFGIAIFLFGNPRPHGSPRWEAPLLHEFNRRTIRTYEDNLDDVMAALATFPAQRTLLATVELAGRGGAGSVGFLYPYHRHLQWYEPDRPVALLVPEDGVGQLRPAGGEDFERFVGSLPVPASVDRLVLVLAGSPDPQRLALPPAQVVLSNQDFLVLSLPFRGELRFGALNLRRSATPSTRVVSKGW